MREKIKRPEKPDTKIIARIISGGQTGADQAGLFAAHDYKIPTGGFAPQSYMTEEGPDSTLKRLGLKQTKSPNYPVRTKLNVTNSDLTILFELKRSDGGTKLTGRYCRELAKPLIRVHNLSWYARMAVKKDLFLFSKQLDKKLIINVAGPRESKNPGIERKIYYFLAGLFVEFGYKKPRMKIRHA